MVNALPRDPLGVCVPLLDHLSLFYGYLKGATPWPQAKVRVEEEPFRVQTNRLSRPGAQAGPAHLCLRPRMWHPVPQCHIR